MGNITETCWQTSERRERLETRVRQILLQANDDHCCLDWGTIYPELARLVGLDHYEPRVLPPIAMARNCLHFIECFVAKQPDAYVAPVMTEEEGRGLRASVEPLRDRVRQLEKEVASLTSWNNDGRRARDNLERQLRDSTDRLLNLQIRVDHWCTEMTEAAKRSREGS